MENKEWWREWPYFLILVGIIIFVVYNSAPFQNYLQKKEKEVVNIQNSPSPVTVYRYDAKKRKIEPIDKLASDESGFTKYRYNPKTGKIDKVNR